MKHYYRLLLLLILLAGCKDRALLPTEDGFTVTVSSVKEAGWHAFFTPGADFRRITEAIGPKIRIPGFIREVHFAGDESDIYIIEGSTWIPRWLITLFPPGKNWEWFKGNGNYSKIIRGKDLTEVALPALEGCDAAFFFRGGDGDWSGSFKVLVEGGAGKIEGSYPAPKDGGTFNSHPRASLVFMAAEGSTPVSRIIGKRSPSFEIAISGNYATLQTGRHRIQSGVEEERLVVKRKPFTLYLHYDRSSFSLPSGLSLPPSAVRWLRTFDYFEIICENRGLREECRGEFKIKEYR